ncbi:MAG: potassium transporter TrkH, partial [Pseudomonadota bacterium]|nr:potassium transporter TrkH [Pseudomonadota bacterium]
MQRLASVKLFTISKKYTIDLSPPTVLALGFLSFMLIGTLLLKLPFATVESITWIEA